MKFAIFLKYLKELCRILDFIFNIILIHIHRGVKYNMKRKQLTLHLVQGCDVGEPLSS